MNPLKSIIESVERYYKLLGPVFLTLLGLYAGIGAFIYYMYTFNVDHKISDSFPSQFEINLFFICALVTATLVLVIILFQTVSIHDKSNNNNMSA